MTKLQSALQDLKHELDAAKLTLAEECKKNVELLRNLEYVAKEKECLDTKLVSMVEDKKENMVLKVWFCLTVSALSVSLSHTQRVGLSVNILSL